MASRETTEVMALRAPVAVVRELRAEAKAQKKSLGELLRERAGIKSEPAPAPVPTSIESAKVVRDTAQARLLALEAKTALPAACLAAGIPPPKGFVERCCTSIDDLLAKRAQPAQAPAPATPPDPRIQRVIDLLVAKDFSSPAMNVTTYRDHLQAIGQGPVHDELKALETIVDVATTAAIGDRAAADNLVGWTKTLALQGRERRFTVDQGRALAHDRAQTHRALMDHEAKRLEVARRNDPASIASRLDALEGSREEDRKQITALAAGLAEIKAGQGAHTTAIDGLLTRFDKLLELVERKRK